MPEPRVLLDTNILVSGLVFSGGNEHRILRLAEDGEITLVLPEFVLQETKRVLSERFSGFEGLLDVFLSKLNYVLVHWGELETMLPQFEGQVGDRKDIPVLAAVVASEPDFAVTGDRALREDLRRCVEVSGTKICSSRQFLEEFSRWV